MGVRRSNAVAPTRFATGEVDLDEQLVRQLTERARAEGLKLTGEGLVQRLTKLVVQCSLEGEFGRSATPGSGNGTSGHQAGFSMTSRPRA